MICPWFAALVRPNSTPCIVQEVPSPESGMNVDVGILVSHVRGDGKDLAVRRFSFVEKQKMMNCVPPPSSLIFKVSPCILHSA